MKLLSEIKKPSPFDIKVEVEMNLMELAAIHIVFSKISTYELTEKFKADKDFRHLADFIDSSIDEKDVGFELYNKTKEIMSELLGKRV